MRFLCGAQLIFLGPVDIWSALFQYTPFGVVFCVAVFQLPNMTGQRGCRPLVCVSEGCGVVKVPLLESALNHTDVVFPLSGSVWHG